MNAKRKIVLYYFVVVGVFLFLFICCIYSIIKIQYIEGEVWQSIGNTIKQSRKPKIVKPLRGEILCYNTKGEKEILAASMKVYKIYFNGEQLRIIEKDRKDKKKKFNRVDSVHRLSVELSKYFGDAPASHYRSIIDKAYRNRKKIRLIGRDVDYVERKDIMKFPLFNTGGGKYTDCMHSEEVNKRVHPFGQLALRTIGDVYPYKTNTTDGEFGIEMAFDSILKGVEGIKYPIKISRRKTVYVEKEKPVNGANITLTLNIDMQDIVHNALMEQAKRLSINRGCAVLMEVETGEIKAIANLYRSASGEYFEWGNMAIADLNPPGSTFKLLSMLVAFETGKFTPNTMVDSYHKRYPKVSDHAPNPKWSNIKASEVFAYSSNVGTSNIIGSLFEDNPMGFVRAIQKTKVNQKFDIRLPGATGFRIGEFKYWNIKDTIDKTLLPTMSYGYQVAVPPIYMLRFYNAVANDGKMVNPFLVKEIDDNGDVTEYGTEVVTKHIASVKTIKGLQTILKDVVEQKGGTGYHFRSKKVTFAGKTGTAYFNGTDQVSFCGYFPADNPKYSCIVVMFRRGIWGTHSCEVFRNIAERITALNSKVKVSQLQDTIQYLPLTKNGNAKSLKYILSKLDIDADFVSGDWLKINADATPVNSVELTLKEGLMPDVVGMGAKDAVFLLEKRGLRVDLSGKGRVVSQSVPSGRKIIKGQSIRIHLR